MTMRRWVEVPLEVAVEVNKQPLMSILKTQREKEKECRFELRICCLNFAKQNLLRLRVMAWKTLSRQGVQMERHH